ncbi:MAG: TetR/AcrR family transcriptional regulator [Actinomycetales bacterium]|nr:TetR/AcrR family transcriptional regulator [Actinomycetales bacterium]
MTQLESPPAGAAALPEGAEGAAAAPPAVRPGRRRDPSRDADILAATLDVLAEVGYDGMTMDMVAARAQAGKATVYRRWESKADLVIDAVACLKSPPPLDDLPDTGSLRGDLVAMIRTPSVKDAQRKLRIMTGLVSLIDREPELAETTRRALVEPRAAVTRALLRRAVERGEARPDCDIETLASVSAAMASYRTLMLRKPVDREFLLSVIDGVIVPAAVGAPGH